MTVTDPRPTTPQDVVAAPKPATLAVAPAAASAIERRYRERSPRSAELFARAERLLPGGNSRQAAFWRPYPLFLERGQGAHVEDVDGNRLLDLTYNYSALVHGHAYPPIVAAVDLARGSGWAANNVAMLDLAEQLVERVPSVEQVRFTNSGTEAAMLALQVARAVTGRRKILMARFGYHGSLDEHETGTFGHVGPATLVAEYDDLRSWQRVLAESGNEVAAVFVEPVMGAGGVRAGSPEFLHGLAAAARAAGAVLVVDEVITYRLATGGRQQVVGLEPDLTMFGKLIGGGFPVGALGGRADLMRVFHPDDGRAFHSGTYNANPVTMAAGAVAVRELTAGRIEAMHVRAESLERSLRRAAARLGLPFTVRRVGSLLNLFLSETAPASTAQRTDLEAAARFHLACVDHGVLMAPRGMMVLSTVMDDALIAELASRVEAALSDVAAELV